MDVRVLARKKNENLSDKQRSLVTYYDQRSPIAEQFRTLRTNIQFASVDKIIRKIMVTSSTPGDGKSTTIANLGIVLAQQEKRVLIVDSDLRKPTVHFTFQLPNQTGLTSVLTKQSTFDDAVLETAVPFLEVLTSGPVPPNPSELLGSKSMKDFVKEIEGAYDYILFDAPPVNVVTDPQILAENCDGVILVIRSGKTEVESAQKALDSLKKVEANVLGVVLNDQKQSDGHHYYYYNEK
ncbi:MULTISPECIES: CpsD/CapB family tyrosine-protein kinase [Bacillaceae]|uniref:non-specific protein-tyrosine kinase n=1 Tax=Evansella alkalicola TaxID=745819 RepID=A0ABS6JWU8_9BACI|nr:MULTISPECIES: CpsD/CapB family tyrosine-protein kinase [Bacillaceae]MBU9723068.1 CpsD/CapB family tyrosine-protein kinase [Bacillus alkalicola]